MFVENDFFLIGGLEILDGVILEVIFVGLRVGIDYVVFEDVVVLWCFVVVGIFWVSVFCVILLLILLLLVFI